MDRNDEIINTEDEVINTEKDINEKIEDKARELYDQLLADPLLLEAFSLLVTEGKFIACYMPDGIHFVKKEDFYNEEPKNVH